MRISLRRAALAGTVFVAFGLAQAQAATPVALELSLLLDVSGSVSSTEYALQRDGYVNAFNSVAVQNAIASLSGAGGIAVNLIRWSGALQQQESVGWTHITNATQASAFASAVSALTYASAYGGSTAPGSAINFAVPKFFANDYTGTRLVIDVSGDGEQNDGASTSAARTAAISGGITAINGLPIGNSTLAAWYAANIQGGATGFTLPAATFEDFNSAIQAKLVAEISNTPVPEPATMALLGTGLLGLGFLRRRKTS